MSADVTLTDTRPFVASSAHNGVATLTLNRPERFNTLASEMIAALQAELDAIRIDRSVGVVILAADGRGFCAGHDLKEIRAHLGDEKWQRQLFDACGRMMMSLLEMP